MTRKREAQTTNEAPACCAAGRPPPAERVAAPEAAVPEASAGPRSRDGMVHLPGGRFLMGADDAKGFPQDGEGPVRKVNLEPFWIGARAVTNAEFAAFVGATGYRTEAEHIGWSYVFDGFLTPTAERRVKGVAGDAPWWCAVVGASWERPEGPGSDLEGRADHPAVHVSHNDALAYCSWAGRRLPTEAEWEYAARGGLKQRRFPWGNTLTPAQEHRCNVWQGTFPDTDNAEDGYSGTAPADAYEPNGFGLYNVAGNVWEWCSDWFSPTHHARASQGGRETLDNPTGPPNGTARVIRGGSYLCHKSYCNRYRVAARSKNTPDSSTGNMGFRCAA